MAFSMHAMTIRTVALAVAFAKGKIDFNDGRKKFTAVFDRNSKMIRDLKSNKQFSSAFKWILSRLRKNGFSSSDTLFIGNLTVKEWMAKIEANQNLVTLENLLTARVC